MSYYRDVYLNSEDWKNLRAAKLSLVGFKCQLCRFKSESNDVHHLKYRKLHDVRLEDLRVLCRQCHDDVHALLKKYPKLKTLDNKTIWDCVFHHLRPRWLARINGKTPANKSEIISRQCHARFQKMKGKLIRENVIFGKRMQWRESLVSVVLSSIGAAEFLEHFISATGIDPRKPVEWTSPAPRLITEKCGIPHCFRRSIQEEIC